jgi:small subunit ribosomal protein S17
MAEKIAKPEKKSEKTRPQDAAKALGSAAAGQGAPAQATGIAASDRKARDIGIDVPMPERSCTDRYCPFHGTLPVRGTIIAGQVVSDRMNRTVVVKRDYLRLIPKFERYEKRTGKYSAHNPPCIDAKAGEEVTIAECRPISKTVSFVVIERK